MLDNKEESFVYTVRARFEEGQAAGIAFGITENGAFVLNVDRKDNRTKLISSLDNKLVEPFNMLSQKTRVPKSRLIDEAIEDLLKKYEKRMAE